MKTLSSGSARFQNINRTHRWTRQGRNRVAAWLAGPERLEIRDLLTAAPLSTADFTFLGAATANINQGFLSGFAYRPETNTFFTIGGAGSRPYDLIEMSVPVGPGNSTLVKDWGDIDPNNALQSSGSLISMQGLWWDDANQRLWISWGSYYNATHANSPCLAYLTLDTGAPVIHGPWYVSPTVGSDNVRGSIVPAPPELTAITGQPFMSLPGMGSTAQDESWGEQLVSLADPSSLPVGGTSSAEQLINWPELSRQVVNPNDGTTFNYHYSNFPRMAGDSVITIKGNDNVSPPTTLSYQTNVYINGTTMTEGDGLYQGVWIDTPQLTGLVYFGRLSLGYAWYGNPNAHADSSAQGVAYGNDLTSIMNPGQPLIDSLNHRGNHADEWAWRAYFVSPQDVLNTASKVKAGTATPADLQISPYSIADMATLGGNVPAQGGGTTSSGIYFDSATSILYLLEPNNQILEWRLSSNTTPTPISNVEPLADYSPASFTVSWSGIDVNGPGIANYNVYVSDNGAAFVPFETATTATSATFTGVAGHTYGFYSIATDTTGHVEVKAAKAEVSTTVPAGPPTSSVLPLPAGVPANFTVSWSGSDPNGPGIATYNVYVSDNGGPFTSFQTATANTSATFQGVVGHTYGFYSVASDLVGDVEATPTAAEATTRVFAGNLVSQVAALPAYSIPVFTVTWSGSDLGGPGLASYDVFVSDNGGVFTPLLTATTGTAVAFHGKAGHTYGFYSVAIDTSGDRQQTPLAAQATTTVAGGPPTSTVAPLPAYSPASFIVSWSGSDDGGPGVATYDVYVSDNGGAYTPFITATTATTGTFQGVIGHSYRFYSVATDLLGERETAPATAEAATTVADANGLFILAAYQDVLARSVDTAGLAYWDKQLNAGVPRSTVVNLIDHSAEYFGNEIITPAYQQYLGRDPDSAGVAYWVNQMQQHGLTDERLEAGLIGSAEFFNRAGGTNKAWVDALYQDFLGRPADPAGEATWVAALAAGMARADVAFGFANSQERQRLRATDDYMHYLARLPDSQGLAYFVNQLATGAITNETLITEFVASDEYFKSHTN